MKTVRQIMAETNAPEWCAGKKMATIAEWIDHVAV